MRVIAGRLGGRMFESPRGHRTHPMSDKVRAALFNVLGDIEGLCVLDAFAGSGALAFEALSRGAREVLLLESDRVAQKTIEGNIATLKLKNVARLVKAPAGSWLTTTKEAGPLPDFDIVLCDPPYDDLQLALVQRLSLLVRPSGVLVLSWPGKQIAPDLEKIALVTNRNYGDAQLVFYRPIP